MRKVVTSILILCLLPVINITSQIMTEVETISQCNKHVRRVKLAMKTDKRRNATVINIDAFAVDNSLTITFTEIPVDENAAIIISNQEGEIIYEDNVMIIGPTEINIPINRNETEEYLLEIYSGTFYCYGYF